MDEVTAYYDSDCTWTTVDECSTANHEYMLLSLDCDGASCGLAVIEDPGEFDPDTGKLPFGREIMSDMHTRDLMSWWVGFANECDWNTFFNDRR